MAHATARVAVHVRLDGGERFKAESDTGPFWVEHVDAYRFPPVGSSDRFAVRGAAIKKDGTPALFNRTGWLNWADLPGFLQSVILDEVASTADTAGSWEQVG